MAEVSGKFRFQTTILSDYPAVGNFVLVNWNESGNSSIIESLLPRKSAFIRKAAGEPQQEQIVAANIDTVFLCMALNHDFNLRRLERYISIAWDSGAMPVVVLTKSDLCDDLEQKLSEVSSVAFGVDVLVTTSTEENGYKELLPLISEGKTIAFIGSSGVGKSTLMNKMVETYVGKEEKMVMAKDMLFATLDTTVRKITQNDKKDFLLSDTVGFISKLPHGLVKAFRSTLDEVRYADLLLEVVDASDEHYREHMQVTAETLRELGLGYLTLGEATPTLSGGASTLHGTAS